MKNKFKMLSDAKTNSEIQNLDSEIAVELEHELQARKKLKVQLENVVAETEGKEKDLEKANEKLIELPEFVSEVEELLRKGYEKFSGLKVLSKDETSHIKNLPSSLSVIFNKFYNYNNTEENRITIHIDGEN